MKRIAWAALAATACLALLAGKDDIRRFYRMSSMSTEHPDQSKRPIRPAGAPARDHCP